MKDRKLDCKAEEEEEIKRTLQAECTAICRKLGRRYKFADDDDGRVDNAPREGRRQLPIGLPFQISDRRSRVRMEEDGPARLMTPFSSYKPPPLDCHDRCSVSHHNDIWVVFNSLGVEATFQILTLDLCLQIFEKATTGSGEYDDQFRYYFCCYGYSVCKA